MTTYPLIVQLLDGNSSRSSLSTTLIMFVLGIPIRIFSSYNMVRSFQLLR